MSEIILVASRHIAYRNFDGEFVRFETNETGIF
jgi:hypothetical protein